MKDIEMWLLLFLILLKDVEGFPQTLRTYAKGRPRPAPCERLQEPAITTALLLCSVKLLSKLTFPKKFHEQEYFDKSLVVKRVPRFHFHHFSPTLRFCSQISQISQAKATCSHLWQPHWTALVSSRITFSGTGSHGSQFLETCEAGHD